jgi:UDP-N-acetylglucosamine 4-epimerase
MQKNKIRLLITGGAGFIGSNLVDHFINDNRIALIRIVDDLSTGYFSNIEKYQNNPKFEFIKGDITDYQTCLDVTKGIDKVSHQAALGSVPRSIENPMRSSLVNIIGTLNLLHACHTNSVERIVLACSSSTYGDNLNLPKVEDLIGNPLSPYALTKLCVEQMAEVFKKTYNLNYVGLRYFNVFGPKQNANNSYAAVIPIFCKSFLNNISPTVNGDGETSRDFTFIDNVVLGNELALFTTDINAVNQIYNIACGESITLNDIINKLQKISGNNIKPVYGEIRKGDVRHSLADITKITTLLKYKPITFFDSGLEKVYEWYKQNVSLI